MGRRECLACGTKKHLNRKKHTERLAIYGWREILVVCFENEGLEEEEEEQEPNEKGEMRVGRPRTCNIIALS